MRSVVSGAAGERRGVLDVLRPGGRPSGRFAHRRLPVDAAQWHAGGL